MVIGKSSRGGRGPGRCVPGLAQRARIVLLAADGVSNTEIADRVGMSRPTVIDWRPRYERSGIAGLEDGPRSGRPRTVDHDAIITATLSPPPKRLGVTHWSSRLLAKHLRIGNATVARAWRDYGVQPWRAETFKFSTDPELVAKGDRRRRALPGPAGERDRAVHRRVGSGWGAPPFLIEWRVSPARPPNPACASPRTGLSTI